MANTYKNAAVVLTSTGATDLYTAPSNTRSLVQSVNIANVDGSDRYATVTWYDASAGASYTLLYNGFLPAGTSMNALDTPCVLEPGDIIRVQASAANTLHATASIMEQDPTTPHVDGSITTAKIADDAVTADKLASSLTTTLPASPKIGEVVIYEADSTNGVFWALVYDGVGSYPWKFVGGPPLYDYGGGYQTITSTSYVDLTGVTINTTLAGDYDVRLDAQLQQPNVNGYVTYLSVSHSGVTLGDYTYPIVYAPSTGGVDTGASRMFRIPNLSANNTLQGRAKVNAGTGYVGFCRLTATPVRVAG